MSITYQFFWGACKSICWRTPSGGGVAFTAQVCRLYMVFGCLGMTLQFHGGAVVYVFFFAGGHQICFFFGNGKEKFISLFCGDQYSCLLVS